MNKVAMLVTVLVAIAVVGCAFTAFAADTKACADVKATVTGKVEVKTEKVDGKDAKVAYINVTEAKGEDGKAIADLKGKSLKAIGAKAAEVEKHAGKEVEAKGTVKAGKEIDVTSVAEKTAPAVKK